MLACDLSPVAATFVCKEACLSLIYGCSRKFFIWPQDHALESESTCLPAGEAELSGLSRVRCSLGLKILYCAITKKRMNAQDASTTLDKLDIFFLADAARDLFTVLTCRDTVRL